MLFMSRIITKYYIEKLNELIKEFEQSSNLTCLVNFFMNEVQKDQNRKGNKKIFSSKDFQKVKELIDSDDLKRIFAYISTIVKGFKGQYLHVHLNVDLSENLIDNLITLAVWDALSQGLYDDDILDEQINLLKIKTARPLEPLNSNGHLLNQIYRERYGLQHNLKFIEKIKILKKNNQKSGILINLNSSAGSCVNLSEFSVCPKSLNTYVNFGNSRKNIFKEMGREKVERISMILNLFPSITGKNIWYKDFMSNEINSYSNFKKVITITSGEKTPEALLEMQKLRKFKAEEIYTIFSFEL
jgi:hypothetical protein